MELTTYEFNQLSYGVLQKLTYIIEKLDSSEILDIDNTGKILKITCNKFTYLINTHEPSKEIWIASPLSGGIHFKYNGQDQIWYSIKNNCELLSCVKEEINNLLLTNQL